MDRLAPDPGEPGAIALPADRILTQVRDHAIVLIDTSGRKASWNEGVREIFGFEAGEWIGQPVHLGFTDEDIAAGVPEAELRAAANTGRADDDRWMARKGGERFFAAGSVSRLVDDAGQLVGFLKVLRDLTAWQHAQAEHQALLQAERRTRADAQRQAAVLKAAITAIPDGLYIGNEDGIVECNTAALKMLGVASLHDLRSRIDELGHRFRVRYERPADSPRVEPDDLPFARALRGETAQLETWATRPNGEDVLIRGTAAPIVLDGRIVGAVAVNTDLTEQRRLERSEDELRRVSDALRERDEVLHKLVSKVRNYAIFTIDLEGRISSWHEGAERMKGYSAEEAVGMPFENLFTPEDRAKRQPSWEMAIAARTGEYKGEGVRIRKDGNLFDAAVVLTALRGPGGELTGYLKLTQDISQRKRIEREREQLLRIAEAARAEAERANHFKGEFLATISHELRTPLGAILGWAKVLERGAADAATLEQGLAAITRNARVQVQMIEDLLDMSRIEAGELRLQHQPVELQGVTRAAIEALLPTAERKGVEVRTESNDERGIVSGDPQRLQQIVWNLLSNAIKFTPPGGHVTVSLRPQGHEVELAVADTGQGIAPDFLARVFDRFRQQDNSATRRYGGLGLGLAIVQQLTQLHGGRVRAESGGADRGATFTVTLPAHEAATASFDPSGAPVPQQHADHHPAAPTRLDGLTLLLIDDEPDGRAVAAHVLREAGAQVLTAASAREGYSLLRSRRPDAILSDIAMPGHDGYEFIRWVRRLAPDEGGQTPAAAFTAYARQEDWKRALAAGFQSHLVKPVEPQALVAAAAALAGGR